MLNKERRYASAKQRVFSILRSLGLPLSPHKTRMGRLNRGFHYLRVDFEVSRNPQGKENQAVTVKLHPRSCRRARDKVKAMREDAVPPAQIQRDLIRWATWWHSVTTLGTQELLLQWIQVAIAKELDFMWLGRGLVFQRWRL